MASFKFTRRGIVTLAGTLSTPVAWPLDAELETNRGKDRTAAELAAAVTPTDFAYPPGNPRRYGAVGDGVRDDTAALAACISCNATYIGNQGDIYGVTAITFPRGGPRHINFNGSRIRGIATVATTAVVVLKIEETCIYDYRVDTFGHASTPNTNYTCATWWYDSAHQSQFNSIYGCLHEYCVRGMIYGELPGHTSTAIAQSENAIYGWRTEGCQNPFYGNAVQGFVHFSEPIFYSGAEGWTKPSSFSWTNARAFENYGGQYYAQGGELQHTNPLGTAFAADLQSVRFLGMNIETATPMQIVGDGVQLIGGSCTMDAIAKSSFQGASGVTGTLQINAMRFQRTPGKGGWDNTPLIDMTAAAPTFETILSDTMSFEWRWSLVSGGTVKLVKGAIARYRNHRLSITTSDSNVYMIDSRPAGNLLPQGVVDRLGYSTTGWFAKTATLTQSNNAGPAGYLASQLSCAGSGTVTVANPSSAATVRQTAIPVRPGETYWVSGWLRIASGTRGSLICSTFDSSGTETGNKAIADQGFIGTTGWTFCDGPFVVPAHCAYIAPGVLASASTVEFTDIQIHR
jgi:hypothetical protein